MDEQELNELAEVIQSSNLNFLFGAGVSSPFLPLLGGIEGKLNKAAEKYKEAIYKEYLEKIMLPNKGVAKQPVFNDYPSWEWNNKTKSWSKRKHTDSNSAYKETQRIYEYFFRTISRILLNRKANLLGKQANIFTTNIDVLMENILEELQLEYNDGFSGRFRPSFNIANYKKTTHQRSLHFDHISEVPTFNVLKIHGSLTWKYDSDEKDLITASHRLEHFDSELLTLTGEKFKEAYKKILVVNPEATKNLESVLNIYYSELLRLFSSELEKENATLFVVGFSMEDNHIKEIVLRAAKSNPTLRVYVFCHSAENLKNMESKLNVTQHPNIRIIAPVDNKKQNLFDLENVAKIFFSRILAHKKEKK